MNFDSLGDMMFQYGYDFNKLILKDSLQKRANKPQVLAEEDKVINEHFTLIANRNIDTIMSVGRLLRGHHSIDVSFFTISSALRGAMLNCLIVLYMATEFEKIKDSDLSELEKVEAVKKIIYGFNADHILNIRKDYRVLRDMGLPDIDSKEQEFIDEMNKHHGAYFNKQPLTEISDTKESNLIYRHQKITGRHAASHSKSKDLALEAFWVYYNYSKVDHTGILTGAYMDSMIQSPELEFDRIKRAALVMNKVNHATLNAFQLVITLDDANLLIGDFNDNLLTSTM